MPKLVRNGLTARKVENAKPGKYADGHGLYLVVSEGDGKSWVWRGTVLGARKEYGIGSEAYLPLSEAREVAWKFSKEARAGRDPRAAVRRSQGEALTFEMATDRCWQSQIKPQVKTDKQATLWINMMRTYAVPILGKMLLSDIRQQNVKAVLAPIWLEKEETARRVRQRIRTVFNWARTEGLFDGADPTEGVEDGLPRQSGKVRHAEALPYAEAPALMRRLAGTSGVSALALRFAILTATRTGSVRAARWQDFKGDVWTVPEASDKMGRGFQVPLSAPALAVLGEAKGLSDELIFPGMRNGRPLSDMSLTKVLRTLDVPVTVHGFRTTFRVWAEEQTDYRHEIKEAALAHKVSNAVERAYNRTDLFDARRALMDDWAAFLEGQQ